MVRFTLLAVALVFSPSLLWAEDPAPNTPQFYVSTKQALRTDTEAMRDYAFRRQVIRQSLNRDGGVSSKEVLVSRVTPTSTGFDERLTEIDGRTPTAREVRRFRKDATFSKHYRQIMAGSVDLALVADLRLSILLETYAYEFIGEEMLDGVRCFRYDVSPFHPPEGATKTQQIAAASRGSFWITARGQHLAQMQVELARPLKLSGVTLRTLDMALERQEQGSVWLTTRVEVRSEFTLGITVRRHNIWTYTDFEKLKP